MNRIENILSKTFLAVLSIFLAFAFLESATNLFLLYWADEDTFIRYASLRQLQERMPSNKLGSSPHRYLGYYPTPDFVNGKNRHNALGYRGKEISIPKPQGEFRIVCIGGSTTYTAEVHDYRKSYPDLLEKYLRGNGFENVRVVNAGAGGWSSWESLINFELRVLDLDPDLIIVYHGLNDTHSRIVWPPEAYRGDNSGHRAPNQSGLFMPSIFQHITILRILMIRMGSTTSHADLERTIDRPSDTYYGSLFHYQKSRGAYPKRIFQEISAKKMLEKNKPIYFERNIRNIIAIAKNWGTEVVISSFAYSPLFTEQPRVSSEEYISALEENNRLLRTIAEDMEVYFFDFASKFPTDKRYYEDGRHVNENGARLKAKLFGDFIIEKPLIPSTEN